jgi:hypothetical protein
MLTTRYLSSTLLDQWLGLSDLKPICFLLMVVFNPERFYYRARRHSAVGAYRDLKKDSLRSGCDAQRFLQVDTI